MAVPPFQPVPDKYNPTREREVLRVLERTLDRLDVDVEALKAGGGGGGGPGPSAPVPRGINAELRTANATTLVVGTDFVAVLPYNLTLNPASLWTIRTVAGETASVVVDVQRATVAAPDTFVSIAASAKPTLTADNYNTGTMTGWPTSLLAGETIRLVVESASGTNRVAITIPAST